MTAEKSDDYAAGMLAGLALAVRILEDPETRLQVTVLLDYGNDPDGTAAETALLDK